MNMETIREIAALEAEAEAAAAVLRRVSLRLRTFERDIKLSGWNWDRASSIASLSLQGHLNMRVVELSERTGASR